MRISDWSSDVCSSDLVPTPNGLGVEAAGVVEAIGPGVSNVAVGDRVTYTGFVNTLGAYSTARLIPADALIKLPETIAFETAAAMTMRGLTSAYLMPRIDRKSTRLNSSH